MKSKKISIDEIGTILLEKSSRAGNINISIRPFRGIRVAVPEGVSFARAIKVVESKTWWIDKHLKKIKKLEQNCINLPENSIEIDKIKAKNRLINRLNTLADRHGFTFNRVFIRNQKTRWGSCSGKNNINLNIKLVLLPQKLLDYIILHELVHTCVKDHSKKFWLELDKFVGDSKKIDSEVNKFNILLFR
ncbi:MAG: M48 family metallopeptidase [Desulfobacterales bacterium]|nr:M48 family metallopeptidase [Desulfobacterales bacterium]